MSAFVYPISETSFFLQAGRDIVRVCIEDGADGVEAVGEYHQCQPLDLCLLLGGRELHGPVLEAVEDAVAARVDPGAVFVRVRVRRAEYHELVAQLDDLDHVERQLAERFADRVSYLRVHRQVSASRRLAARARLAASRSIAQDLTIPPSRVAAPQPEGARP